MIAQKLELAEQVCQLPTAVLRAELRQRQDDGRIKDATSDAIRRELGFRGGILQPRAVEAALKALADKRPPYPYITTS